MARVEPTTLPQLNNTETRGRSKAHSESNKSTLPQLKQGDGLTRQPTILAPSATPDRVKKDAYGNRLPMTPTGKSMTYGCTGELGYDGLNGTRKIGPSFAKSVVYIWRILDMHRTWTKHIVRHMQKSVVQWSVISKFTCICTYTYIDINIYSYTFLK